MFNTYCIFIILSILSIIIIKVYYYFKKVEEFNNFIVTGKYGKNCQILVGEVYSCGYNYYGQLGLNYTRYQIPFKIAPQKIQTFYNYEIKITEIACGAHHSLFLTNDGSVYSCGYNDYGQLGLNSTNDQIAPQKIQTFYDNEIKITKIACGSSYSLFLTNDGRVYSCGSNVYGQLGLNSTNDQIAPQLIQTFYDNEIKITKIAGGANHSLFLTNDESVYSCGYNGNGELGLNYTKDIIPFKTAPQLIQTYYDYGNAVKDKIKITKIACGYYHSLFLTNDDRVYSCGSNYSGQLGYYTWYQIPFKTAPQLIKKFYNNKIKITKIAGGYFHSLFLTDDGRVYSCGYNAYGQLGLNSKNSKEIIPQLIETYYNNSNEIKTSDDIKITKIACGNHSLFLTDKGHVYSCGYNAYGQLGLYSKNSKETTPQLIQTFYDNEIKITKIAGGGNHSSFIRFAYGIE